MAALLYLVRDLNEPEPELGKAVLDEALLFDVEIAPCLLLNHRKHVDGVPGQREIGFVRLLVLFAEAEESELNLRLHQDGLDEKGEVRGRNGIVAGKIGVVHRNHYSRLARGTIMSVRHSIAVWLFLAVSAIAPAQQAPSEVFSVPPADAPQLAARGSYAVGVRTIDLVHRGQIDILRFNKDTGKAPLYDRPLKVEVWYPAVIPPGQQERTVYEMPVPGGHGFAGSPVFRW